MPESWSSFRNVIINTGFTFIVQRRFWHDGKHPQFIIAAHRTKFLLLVATSLVTRGYEEGEVINGGTLYGTLFTEIGMLNSAIRQTLQHVSYAATGDHTLEFTYDIHGDRDFAELIDRLAIQFQFVRWNNPQRHLYLVDYSQTDTSDYLKDAAGFEARLKAEYLASAPDWVSDFVLNG